MIPHGKRPAPVALTIGEPDAPKRVKDSTPLPIKFSDAAELTERMRNDRPATGYRIWVEIDDPNHFYTLEAPAGSATGDAVFRGIRVAKSVSGSPSGEIQVNAGGTLSWDNKTTDGGWG